MDVENKKKATEEWELDAVGRFLIDLYHRNLISRKEQWLVPKFLIRQKFEDFLHQPNNNGLREKFQESLGAFNVGYLLDRCKFLINSKRGSKTYNINYANLFGDQMLDMYEKRYFYNLQENSKNCGMLATASDGIKYPGEINGKWQLLEYMGTNMQEAKQDNESSKKWYCLICQISYTNDRGYRSHMERHSTADNILWANKFVSSILTVWSQSDETGKKVYFKLELGLPNRNRLIVEKLYLLKSNSVFCVSQPLHSSNSNILFCIDKQMLNNIDKQPLIFILRDPFKKDLRIAEQHNYTPKTIDERKLLLPNLKTCFGNERVCEATEILLENYPSEKLENDYAEYCFKQDVSILNNYREFSNYLSTGKQLTVQNMLGTLKLLLQFEDIERFSQAKILAENVEIQSQDTNSNMYYFRMTADTPYDESFIQFDTVYLFNLGGKRNEKNNLLALCRNSTENIYRAELRQYENGYILISTFNRSIPLNTKFTIYGCMARLTLKLQYRALELLNSWSALDFNRFLFPQFITPQESPNNCLILTNHKLFKDGTQLQAIQNICEGPHKDATYIIEGPGGTGKTCVIIESILQLHERKPDAKILVLAPTENACDEIALPLHKILAEMCKETDMTRIYSHFHQLTHSKLQDKHYLNLLKVSNLCGPFIYPAADILHGKRIVICTLQVVGSLSLGGFGRDIDKRGIYSHVFVDNSTSCTEPEILTALSNVVSPITSLILAGDAKQQPTRIFSKYSAECGLNMSLMHRLLLRDCYNVTSAFNTSICTRLIRNYRSHPEIVSVCNRVYNYKMQTMSDAGTLSLYGNWYKLANPMHPILFHHVDNSSSAPWNSMEVALKYIKELMYFGIDVNVFSQNDVAIISNDSLAVQYLRSELYIRNWKSIEVETMENFAGREKNIIICILNLSNYIKNLNTMILCAKSVLIMIGDAKCNEDIYLESLISICRNRKMFKDNDLTDLKDSVDNLKASVVEDDIHGAPSTLQVGDITKPKRNPQPSPKPSHQPHGAHKKKGTNDINKNNDNSNSHNNRAGAVPKNKNSIIMKNMNRGSAPSVKTTPVQEKPNTNMHINKPRQYGNNMKIPKNTYDGAFSQQFDHPPPAYPDQHLSYGQLPSYLSPQHKFNSYVQKQPQSQFNSYLQQQPQPQFNIFSQQQPQPQFNSYSQQQPQQKSQPHQILQPPQLLQPKQPQKQMQPKLKQQVTHQANSTENQQSQPQTQQSELPPPPSYYEASLSSGRATESDQSSRRRTPGKSKPECIIG